MNELIDFLLNNLPDPWNILAVAGALTIIFYMAIPLIGMFINWLEGFEVRLLNQFLSPKAVSFIVNHLTLPGVIVHEYSHAIMATVTGAKVRKIRIVEFFKKDVLGHVEIETNGGRIASSIQLTLASSAPVYISACLLLIMILDILPEINIWWQYILFWYMFVSIFNHMSMSDQDLKMYRKGLPWTSIITFLILIVVTLMKTPA